MLHTNTTHSSELHGQEKHSTQQSHKLTKADNTERVYIMQSGWNQELPLGMAN